MSRRAVPFGASQDGAGWVWLVKRNAAPQPLQTKPNSPARGRITGHPAAAFPPEEPRRLPRPEMPPVWLCLSPVPAGWGAACPNRCTLPMMAPQGPPSSGPSSRSSWNWQVSACIGIGFRVSGAAWQENARQEGLGLGSRLPGAPPHSTAGPRVAKNSHNNNKSQTGNGIVEKTLIGFWELTKKCPHPFY